VLGQRHRLAAHAGDLPGQVVAPPSSDSDPVACAATRALSTSSATPRSQAMCGSAAPAPQTPTAGGPTGASAGSRRSAATTSTCPPLATSPSHATRRRPPAGPRRRLRRSTDSRGILVTILIGRLDDHFAWADAQRGSIFEVHRNALCAVVRPLDQEGEELLRRGGARRRSRWSGRPTCSGSP
jgi:hypothetical protein